MVKYQKEFCVKFGAVFNIFEGIYRWICAELLAVVAKENLGIRPPLLCLGTID